MASRTTWRESGLRPALTSPSAASGRAGLADMGGEGGAGHLLALALGPRRDRHLEGPDHTEDARRDPVEVVAHGELELADIDRRVALGHADQIGEGTDGLGTVSPPA